MNQTQNYTDFTLLQGNGMRVHGVWFPSGGKEKSPAVIISHGFNGCCADLYDQAEAFAEAGIHAFAFDFRGGGERTTSDGRLSEMMTVATECEDLSLVLDYVRGQDDVDASRVFLLGESQGGLISTLIAQGHPEKTAGLILWFPALMIPEASKMRMEKGITEVFGVRLSPNFDREAAGIDPWTGMKNYTARVLLIHGDCDPVVPLNISEKACSLFPDARLEVIPGASHGFGGQDLRKALNLSVSMILE